MSEPLEQVLSAAEWCASNYCTGAEEASLMAAIEHVRAGGWIPCSERMPGMLRWVLFVYAGCAEPCRGYLAGGCWYEYSGGVSIPLEDVTHWMPLPKGPEVKG